MIKEIANFRKKYPDYNDLDDLTLAEKLAAKYPKYSDLPGRVLKGMKEVTDPVLLAQLEDTGTEWDKIPNEPKVKTGWDAIPDQVGKEVTDPAILAQLEGESQEPKGFMEKTISNIPESGWKYLKTLASPETYKGLLEIAQLGTPGLGTLSLILRGKNPVEMQRTLGKGLFDMLSERYGGWENIKKTVSEDPVGFVADLSTLLTGGGTIASKIGPVAKAGQVASRVGKFIEPLSAAKQVITAPAKVIPKIVPRKLYESAVKMSTKLPLEQRKAITEVGLEAGVFPSERGLGKIDSLISSINDEISTKIVSGATRGDVISTDAVLKRLDDLREFYKETVHPTPNLEALDDLIQDFRAYHGDQIPVDKAQRLKQHTYVVLKKSYGELKTASVEGQKQIARGIKEELANLYPELKNLNEKESSLIRLDREIERAVGRISNRDVIGLGLPLKTAAGAVTGAPVTGLIAGILENAKNQGLVGYCFTQGEKVHSGQGNDRAIGSLSGRPDSNDGGMRSWKKHSVQSVCFGLQPKPTGGNVEDIHLLIRVSPLQVPAPSAVRANL